MENIVNTALDVKRFINQSIGSANSWTVAVNIQCSNEMQLQALNKLHPICNEQQSDTELCEILQVSNIILDQKIDKSILNNFAIKVTYLENVILCPRCRRFAIHEENCLCHRCTHVLGNK